MQRDLGNREEQRVGFVQHWTTVAGCTRAVLQVGEVGDVLEEAAAAPFGVAAAERQRRGRAASREITKCRRAEERVARFKLLDALYLRRRRSSSRLRVSLNSAERLRRQVWLPAVEHEHRIECGRIE